MELNTLAFTARQGWSAPFPDLDSSATLVLAFGASAFMDDPAPLAALGAAYPQACVLGCSTSGEIWGTKVDDGSIAVAVARFSKTSLRRASARVSGAADSHRAGRALAEALDDPGLQGILVLSDGLSVNGSELARGFNDRFQGRIPTTGGLAGDGDRFQRTWVLEGGRPQSGHVAAVGFYGEAVRMGHGSKGGWDSFGPERRVTRSQGNVLFELDGKPALELYKGYLGERASGLPATALLFPLALRMAEGEQRQLVRTVLAVDEPSQSLTFAGDIPQGSLAQLMRANFDRLIDGAQEAAERIGAQSGGPALSIAISCVGRRLVLGERTEEEVEATLHALPEGTQQVGFYSYGEIGPFASGTCDLHNQTMTLTVLQEA
ncbi:MAG: FIST C-terminal domain-containing protein [Acidobacteria bacterium]|nr:FIST C-terminal domain-containing protein [Acidobacteriota bacterium]